jgi:hypothetical protein
VGVVKGELTIAINLTFEIDYNMTMSIPRIFKVLIFLFLSEGKEMCFAYANVFCGKTSHIY